MVGRGWQRNLPLVGNTSRVRLFCRLIRFLRCHLRQFLKMGIGIGVIAQPSNQFLIAHIRDFSAEPIPDPAHVLNAVIPLEGLISHSLKSPLDFPWCSYLE